MTIAVILTALSVEYLAIRVHLSDLREEIHPQGTIYECGTFTAKGQNWTVRIAEIDNGSTSAALETERVIAFWKPNVVLSVGVAAGLKDVTAGDVVAAIEVYGYESGKTTESGFLPRPKIGLASYKLEQRAKASARSEDWLNRVQGDLQNWTPKVVIGVIAAGEKEITSSQSEIYQLLQSNYGDALAVDVTGYGVLAAVHRNAGTNALIIRGITHVIDRDVTIDLVEARKVAAQHASAFAFEILAKLEAPSSLGLSPAQYTKLKQNLTDASKGLLSWRRTLNNNQQIERSELNELLNRVKTKESSTTIVLGVPGAGKSALMATLGNELIAQGYAVLAIKADQLNGAINTIDDLQRDLHLELHPSDAIYAISSKEQIVVLIDQLDAVSELMDRKSQRLNLLLSLIQRLSGSKNVHIVATCREFDFRYGSQFARLAEIDRLDLSLPAWENISPILEAAGHQTTTMGEQLRELLQNPLHLSIFLDIAQPGDVFASSQKLLDRLWEERVRKQPESEKCVAFLETLADRMTNEEVLWVPEAISDSAPGIWQALEQAGLLITNPENATIGFRHQTYYDHTLARGFARGSQSLTDLVLERQNGLFVRPILLRGLNYLRGVATQQYQRQLTALLKTSQEQVRPHIRNLLIEFVGAQSNPDLVEAGLLIPLLNSETEGIKVLDAVLVSQGWFRRLRDRPEFTQWLEKPVEQALYSSPLLTAASNFAPEDVWQLLEEYWLNDASYDFLSIRITLNISQWVSERVWFIEQIIRRSNIEWQDVTAIAERIAETLPNHAIKIIRIYLDRLLEQAIAEGNKPAPELPVDADEATRYLHNSQYDPLKPVENLLKQGNFYDIEGFAEAYPQDLLHELWPWFVNISSRIVRNDLLPTNSYRDSSSTSLEFNRGKILDALLIAVIKCATQETSTFLRFVQQNQNHELLAVHRFLARGLAQLAAQEPQAVLEYLIADPRRLCVGDIYDRHRESKRLITAVVPHLYPKARTSLERAIEQFKYYLLKPEYSADFRRSRLKSNRQHRLRLLKAIPDEYLSIEMKRLKQEEERAFPNLLDRDRAYPTVASIVDSPMTSNEMLYASDEHLLNLFDELADLTDGESLFRSSYDLSSEFGKLVKDNPDRLYRILPKLKPERHEQYAGQALENLVQTNFSASNLIQLVEEFDRRGFISEEFREDAAHALQKVAERNQGLSSQVLALMESWLPMHTKPESIHYRNEKEQCSDLKSPILFGIGGSHMLPGGRGSIVRAIAEGYLRQTPPDLAGWTKFIKSQLGLEPHSAVWVDILSRMPPLLNGNRTDATELFDLVIRDCPEVLQYAWALYLISRTIGWFEPKEAVQSWLEILQSHSSSFSQQAYGELLLIQYLQYQDKWSIDRIHHHLATQDNEAILCGLAHAASHLLIQRICQAIAAEILSTLASSSSISVQHAVASVFHWSRDHFNLDRRMMEIVHAVCKNKGVLLEASNDLIEIIEAEELVDNCPEFVAEVCSSLIDMGTKPTNPPARSIILIAESLTTIAIKLHRQQAYREVGLQIFEQLLALNLRETQSALEMLDRRPNRQGYYVAPRRRIRRRH